MLAVLLGIQGRRRFFYCKPDLLTMLTELVLDCVCAESQT
jgi:hypothetical protein